MRLIPIVSLIKRPLSSIEDVFKTLKLSDDNGIFREYTTMVELYNELKFITMLFFIQKILTFNLDVAFLKSVSLYFLTYLRIFCGKMPQKYCICLSATFQQFVLNKNLGSSSNASL